MKIPWGHVLQIDHSGGKQKMDLFSELGALNLGLTRNVTGYDELRKWSSKLGHNCIKAGIMYRVNLYLKGFAMSLIHLPEISQSVLTFDLFAGVNLLANRTNGATPSRGKPAQSRRDPRHEEETFRLM
jgi:hypothetical protein